MSSLDNASKSQGTQWMEECLLAELQGSGEYLLELKEDSQIMSKVAYSSHTLPRPQQAF